MDRQLTGGRHFHCIKNQNNNRQTMVFSVTVFHLIPDLVYIVEFDKDRLGLNNSLVQVPLRFHLETEAKLLRMRDNLGLYSYHCED